ncbi:MAG: DUF721 domain-containing protein [Actinomycetota bacterium]|nr:DUF721 domain-containing protein [Actinomycetota bacterium]
MRDGRGRSPAPKRLGDAVSGFRDSIAPETPLAAIQSVWVQAVGARLAEVARPVSERDGVLVVECESSVWAQELTMMEGRLRARIDAETGGNGPEKIRFRAI